MLQSISIKGNISLRYHTWQAL